MVPHELLLNCKMSVSFLAQAVELSIPNNAYGIEHKNKSALC